jgi:hypothetical protein
MREQQASRPECDRRLSSRISDGEVTVRDDARSGSTPEAAAFPRRALRDR